jgi:hypothetical protein
MRVECPRCGQAIGGGEVDLASQRAVCRVCSEVVSLALPPAAQPSVALAPVPPAGALYRPTDLSWIEEPCDAGAWRVTFTASRLVAVPLLFFALFWDGCLVFWYAMALKAGPPPAIMVLFPLIHVAAGVFITYLALCALLNRTTVRIDRDAFAFTRRPIPQRGDVSEPTPNVVGLEAWQSSFGAMRADANGQRARWGAHLLTRDGRAIPLRFAFSDVSHARFAAARLTQMVAEAQRGDRGYR